MDTHCYNNIPIKTAIQHYTNTKKKKDKNKRSKNKTTVCTTKYTHPDINITTKYRLVQLNYIY